MVGNSSVPFDRRSLVLKALDVVTVHVKTHEQTTMAPATFGH